MGLFRGLKKAFTREIVVEPANDEAEISILGIKAKMVRKTCFGVPIEFSLYIPHVVITRKVTEGDKVTETTLTLDSLTIVSAPMHENTEAPSKQKTK